ncbi:hypothetical protein GJ496_006806 [Pomphorhynchus laevis]|nr:hypothetical protein GJ496_006806 [Pomphorhynchus laevis]
MKIVSLHSGGKDSNFNLLKCVENGHEIVALATLCPADIILDSNSYMYQTIATNHVHYQAEAMKLPLFKKKITGSSIDISLNFDQHSETDEDEVYDMMNLIRQVKLAHQIEAVSTGAIASNYQRSRVSYVCERLDLDMINYMWGRDQRQLLTEMIESGCQAILVKVSSLGLQPMKHIGKTILELSDHFDYLNKLYGFNVCGEGGEYETFTLFCPRLFKQRLKIVNSETVCESKSKEFCQVGYLRINQIQLIDDNPA